MAAAAGNPVLLLDPRPDELALAVAALAAGNPVLLTPRTWLSAAALDRREGAALAGGARLVLANPQRFLPSRRLLRQQIDDGHLGRPGLVRLHHWLPADRPDPPVAPAAGDGEVAFGGALPLALAQDVDVVLWLMGAAPDAVYALQQTGAPATSGAGGSGSGRLLQLHLGFPGGGMALLDFAAALPPGDGYGALSVIGASGAAYFDDHHNTQLLYGGGRPAAVRVEERGRETAALVQDFRAALDRGAGADSGVAAWRAVLAVAGAARRSLAGGAACPPEDV